MAGATRHDNPQSSVLFDVAVVKKIRYFMETACPLPRRQHGLAKV
jgi:hypothetical protein